MLLIRLVFLFESMMRFSLGPHPACRHADRTISSPMKIGVWRVVSEDSDNFGSWLLVIHGFGDLDDLDQPTRSEVSTRFHQIHAFRKLQEVALLGGSQRIPIKERDDGLHQFFPTSNTGVDETGDPTDFDQPFLLIVRSWRIVTAVRLSQIRFADLIFAIQRVSQHSRGFQHMAKFY
jgi:hypothetical protein